MSLENIFISAEMITPDHSETGTLTSQVLGFLQGPHGKIPRMLRL